MTLDEYRLQYPAYKDIPDQQLADALYNKNYAEKLPRDEFDKMIGLTKPVTAGGVAAAAGTGLVKGATAMAGLPGDIASGIDYLIDKVAPGAPQEARDTIKSAFRAAVPYLGTPSSGQLRSNVESVTGKLHEPQNKVEEYTQSVAEMAPGLLAGPGGLVRRGIEQVVLPGAAAQAAGDIPGVKGTAAEPFVRAAAGIAAPIASGRIITPITTPKTRVEARELLQKEGVDVSAGQATGSKFLRKAEEELGGATTENLAQRQNEQFTAAVMKRVGEDANQATPEVVDGAFKRIGGEFDRLSANNVILHDPQLMTDIKSKVQDYNDLVPDALRSKLVQKVEEAVNQQAQPANIMMDGEQYQSLRSRLGVLARGLRKDPEQQYAVYSIQRALDDAMERSIQQITPQQLGEWQQARTQYKNLLTVERAVNYQGEAASSGIITPQNLARAIKGMGGGRDYSRGRTELSVLARAGSEVMAPLANSNTASRARTSNFLHALGAAFGAAGGYGSHLSPEQIVLAATGGALLPRAVGEGLVRGRRILGNAVLPERQTFGANFSRGLLAGDFGRR
jgi:hypothetical protein